jgi:hypothetical protein
LIDEIEKDAQSNARAIYFAEFGSKGDEQNGEMAKDQRILVFIAKTPDNNRNVTILTTDGPKKLTLDLEQFEKLQCLYDEQTTLSNVSDRQGGFITTGWPPKLVFGDSVSNANRLSVELTSENVADVTPEEFLDVIKKNRDMSKNHVKEDSDRQAQRLRDAGRALSGFKTLTSSPNPST